MPDHVDRILEQWHTQRPDLDVSPMAIIGRLTRTAAVVDTALSRTFARHNLDASAFDVLATLLRSGAPHRLTPAALAADAMITSSAVAQRLNKLEAAGLVAREPNPADGRGITVTLTESGKKAIESALPDHLRAELDITGALTSDEQALFIALLQRLFEAAFGASR